MTIRMRLTIFAYHMEIDGDLDPVLDPAFHCDADPDADPDPDFYSMRIRFLFHADADPDADGSGSDPQHWT